MTDHKFTDDDVIETLKNAKYKVDGVVTRGFYLSPETFNAVVDLIGRQEVEIERLNEYISRCKSGEEYWVKCLLERPNEAIKEFAERLKEGHDQCDGEEDVPWLIDKLVKEMTEVDNG